MLPTRRKLIGLGSLIAAILIMSACGPSATDPGPGGVNAGDAKALDDAAKKLDERQTDPAKGK